GVLVATPVLPAGCGPVENDAMQRALLDQLLGRLGRAVQTAWFYTPMALEFAGHIAPSVTVFDSMDELSAFRGASPRLSLLERRLLKQADLVFTGGRSLHAAKRRLHPHVHLFPSSVDSAHFGKARLAKDAAGPTDQARIARPRIGYFGVIDERMDLDLLDVVAERRPDWHFVMLGPVAKIDEAMLPRRPNLHWLGMKSYAELPAYLAGWDAGLMPFALNEATRFISPTKTPEFLAAAVPLVSTPVPDVVSDWGEAAREQSSRIEGGLVAIADGADAVVAALERVMARPLRPWLTEVDLRLSRLSWNATWKRMQRLIEDRAGGAAVAATAGEPARV
ncbi:MAG: glycosyltransferase, partial [Acetobacteraceae bacterium]|nr:glycosyltransferase [Acetobacteraceae bacterium]